MSHCANPAYFPYGSGLPVLDFPVPNSENVAQTGEYSCPKVTKTHVKHPLDSHRRSPPVCFSGTVSGIKPASGMCTVINLREQESTTCNTLPTPGCGPRNPHFLHIRVMKGVHSAHHSVNGWMAGWDDHCAHMTATIGDYWEVTRCVSNLSIFLPGINGCSGQNSPTNSHTFRTLMTRRGDPPTPFSRFEPRVSSPLHRCRSVRSLLGSCSVGCCGCIPGEGG